MAGSGTKKGMSKREFVFLVLRLSKIVGSGRGKVCGSIQ